MTGEDKYWILLSRHISGDLSPDETEELFRWIQEDPARLTFLQETQAAWDKSGEYPETLLNQFDTDAAWLKVSRQIEPVTPPKKVVRLKSFRWLQVAASVLLFSGLAWYSYQLFDQNRAITVANEHSERKQLQLPDGTTIWLNEGGKLSYKKGLAEFDQREVSLEGEAFFEVEHDAEKPFIVRTGLLETQVLGTSFNVVSDKSGGVRVAVMTGKVSFKKRNGEGVFLIPGEKAEFLPSSGIRKSTFRSTNFLYWKDQTLDFENEKLSLVLQEIERAYHIKFNIQNEKLLNQQITTSFKKASVDEVISVLESLLDLKLTPSGDAYVVVK